MTISLGNPIGKPGVRIPSQTSALTGLRHAPNGLSPLISLLFSNVSRQPLANEISTDQRRKAQIGAKRGHSRGHSGPARSRPVRVPETP